MLLFITVQFINVIISTIKSILTVNGGKWTAGLVNATTYTMSAVLIKFIANQSYGVALTVTFITNIIGVPLAKWLLELRQKEKLWVFMATISGLDKLNELEKMLQSRNINYVLMKAMNQRTQASIYSGSRGESALVEEILHQLSINSYHKIETL
nr:MAG TPA: hypothetical protein [Caudoviricetes sp.]